MNFEVASYAITGKQACGAEFSVLIDPLNMQRRIQMNFKALVFGASLALVSATAFAFHCPKDMKKIDAALAKNPDLSAEKLAEVKKLRAEGETLHKAGKHQESVDALGKGMKILGIE